MMTPRRKSVVLFHRERPLIIFKMQFIGAFLVAAIAASPPPPPLLPVKLVSLYFSTLWFFPTTS